MADDRWQSEALRQVTEYHGNDEHQPELDDKQKKGRACHVFTYFLYVYARDRHTGPTTRRRSAIHHSASASAAPGQAHCSEALARGAPTAPASARGMQTVDPVPCSHLRRSAPCHAAILASPLSVSRKLSTSEAPRPGFTERL